MIDNDCNPCRKTCGHCGNAEPVFSVEAMPDDPAVLRFNINGKSVWYDFAPVIKSGETCTTQTVDAVNRTLNYHGECGDNTISAKELGSILHLADLGDVDANSIEDNCILNYRKENKCGEGCEGASGWRSTNAVDVAEDSLEYVLGTDADGKLESLMPPTDTSKFSYLAWGGADKVSWKTPTIAAVVPNDGTYEYPVYMDPATGELVVVRKEVQ